MSVLRDLRSWRVETGARWIDIKRALQMFSGDVEAAKQLVERLVGGGCACIGCVYTPDGKRHCRGQFLRRAEFERAWQEFQGLPVSPKPEFCKHYLSGDDQYRCDALVWRSGQCSRGHEQ